MDTVLCTSRAQVWRYGLTSRSISTPKAPLVQNRVCRGFDVRSLVLSVTGCKPPTKLCTQDPAVESSVQLATNPAASHWQTLVAKLLAVTLVLSPFAVSPSVLAHLETPVQEVSQIADFKTLPPFERDPETLDDLQEELRSETLGSENQAATAVIVVALFGVLYLSSQSKQLFSVVVALSLVGSECLPASAFIEDSTLKGAQVTGLDLPLSGSNPATTPVPKELREANRSVWSAENASALGVAVGLLAFLLYLSFQTRQLQLSDSNAPVSSGTAIPGLRAVENDISKTIDILAEESTTVPLSQQAAPGAATSPGQQTTVNYNKVLEGLWADSDAADLLYTVLPPQMHNPPALAWQLTNNPADTEAMLVQAYRTLTPDQLLQLRQKLQGWGIKVPSPLKLADLARTSSITTLGSTAATGLVSPPKPATNIDPEKLRKVFLKLLSNPSSSSMMKAMLGKTGMPFDEAAFRAWLEDADTFNKMLPTLLAALPADAVAALEQVQEASVDDTVNTVTRVSSSEEDSKVLEEKVRSTLSGLGLPSRMRD